MAGSRMESADPYLTDSPTAWRVRICVLSAAAELVAVPKELVRTSLHGVGKIFRAAFASGVDGIRSGRVVVDLDLEVGYTELGPGNLGLWFDGRDRRGPLVRLLSDRDSWTEAVDGALGVATQELMALVRGSVMRAEATPAQLMVRPVPGVQGLQSRVEVSAPGVIPARMSAQLWSWSLAEDGDRAVRELVSILLTPGCALLEVIFYEGQESEHRMHLRSSPQQLEFARGR